MDDSLVRAILTSIIVYAVAITSMVALLVIGLAILDGSQGITLDRDIALPTRLVVHATAVAIGIVWAGRYSGLSGAEAWIILAVGATLGTTIAVMIATYLAEFVGLALGLLLVVLPPVVVKIWIRRQHDAAQR